MMKPAIHPRRVADLVFAATLAISALASAARVEAFEITAEQREACMGDALRLCGSEIPDVDRVLVCMRAKKSQVSARCKATIPRTLAASL